MGDDHRFCLSISNWARRRAALVRRTYRVATASGPDPLACVPVGNRAAHAYASRTRGGAAGVRGWVSTGSGRDRALESPRMPRQGHERTRD